MADTVARIERKETGIRILLTVLFTIVIHVLQAVVAVLVLFSLAFALITKWPPGERVREFANRTISYLYRILRYLTYNEHTRPFPFSDFPPELEPPAPMPQPGPEQTETDQAAGNIPMH